MNSKSIVTCLIALSLLTAAVSAQNARRTSKSKGKHKTSQTVSSTSTAQGASSPSTSDKSVVATPQDAGKQAPVKQQGPLAYKDIFPLLKEKCGKCHGSDPDGDLVLLTYKDLMNGGEHGKSVTPGQPEKSNLYVKLLDNPPFGKKMPRKGGVMTQEEIDLIKKWIADGAKE